MPGTWSEIFKIPTLPLSTARLFHYYYFPITTQLFSMIYRLLTFVHTAAELGSNPAIQQFQMLMVQTT